MKEYSFYATLTASVQISDEEFNLIMISAKEHYDFKIQSSVESGGWLYGAKNRRDFYCGENKELEMTSTQMQLVMKSLEFPVREKGSELYGKILKIFTLMQETQKDINEKFE